MADTEALRAREAQLVKDFELTAMAQLMLAGIPVSPHALPAILKRFIELAGAERGRVRRLLPQRPPENALGAAVENIVGPHRPDADEATIRRLTAKARRQVARERSVALHTVTVAHRRFLANPNMLRDRILS